MPDGKVILVVLDGLRHDTARAMMGWMEAMVATGRCDAHWMACELPSNSRPLYETILTGRTPVDHGIISNDIVRRSAGDNVFRQVRLAGGRSAAAAYHWIGELYLSAPFDPMTGRLVLDGDGDIQDGVFYWDDGYPDDHLFADAHGLLRGTNPRFLLLHPMNVDHAGHCHGATSKAYHDAARRQGDLLARYAPVWMGLGYDVLVTADHGMMDEGGHGGPSVEEIGVPFYALGMHLDPAPRQTEIAGLCCRLMGIDAGSMPAYEGKVTR